jgi:hypothetical protein
MRPLLAVPLALLVSCSSDGPAPTLAPAPFVQQGQASADLRLNAQKSGSFPCSGGLFFVTSILNQTNAAVRVDALALAFTKVLGSGCASHDAPISAPLAITAPPGVSTEVRRIDLAGDLCAAPHAEPGCEWLAKVTLSTSYGTLTDEIAFHTEGERARVPTPEPTATPTCGADSPTVLSPTNGAVLVGTVPIVVQIARDDTVCPITLNSYVRGVPRAGGPGGFAVYLDFGITYRWNTTASPNGLYRITAQKACSSRVCGGISPPVDVRVSNP